MNECKEHKYRVQGEITDVGCPYCRIAELEHDRDGWIRISEMQEKIVGISQRRISELGQELADEQKAAGYWMEQSCKDHNRAEKVEKELSHYQGGVEVETIVKGDVELFNMGVLAVRNPKLKPFIGQRVRVLVMPLESEV